MKSIFRCVECGKEYPIKEIRYSCDCGELLEVITSFPNFSVNEWEEEFQNKKNKAAFIRYKELLLPDLAEDKIISLNEGDTPLYKANKEIKEYFDIESLYLKHEGMNPTLSFKDRGMVAGVSWANYLGIKKVVCASTGDTSASMAAYASYAGIKSAVLLPKGKVSAEQLSQAISYGANVLELNTDFDGCMKIVQEVAKRKDFYLLNSMNSIRIEGQKAIGIEALHQMNWEVPDYFIIPVGNAGNISALGKGIRELYELGIIDRLPKLIGVESENANPLYESYKNGWDELKPVKAKKTIASAIQIGNPVSFKKAVRELKFFKGMMEQVSEKEIMDSKAVIDNNGIAICPNSATTVAALKKLREKDIIRKDDKVVCILTAHGSKFSNAANDYYSYEKSKFSNKPEIVVANLDEVEKALMR